MPLVVSLRDTGKIVKARVLKLLMIDPPRDRPWSLIVGGQRIEDGDVVASYGFTPESVVHFAMALGRGG